MSSSANEGDPGTATPQTPPGEALRALALEGYAVLDTDHEPAFDELARLTAVIFGAPMSAVSLVDRDRQWFKASVGLEVRETPREDGMCESVVSSRAPLVVPDLSQDPRYAVRRLVTGTPHLRFYAGAPLVDREGHVLGALCVMDVVPRTFSAEQVEILSGLAAQVVAQLELRSAHAAERARTTEAEVARDRLGDVLNGAVSQAIIATDLAGRITLFSEGAVRMLGYREDDMLGRTPQVLHDPDEIAAHAQALGIEPGLASFVRVTPAGAQDTSEWTYVTADARRLRVLVSRTTIIGSRGEPTGFIAVATDISDRHLAQRMLADSEERFRLAFDDSGSGMALVSLLPGEVGRLLRVNTALSRVLGLGEDGLLAARLLDLTHPSDRAETSLALQSLVSGERPSWEQDTRFLHADGRTVWVHLAVAVVRDRGGSPTSAIAHLPDVTDRVASAAEMEGRFHDLATHVDLGFSIRRRDSSRFQYLNPAFFTVFGLDPRAPAPTTHDVLALRHPDDAAAVAQMESAVAAGAVAELECRIVLPGAGVRWIRTKSFPFLTGDRDGDGDIGPDRPDQRVGSIFEDVTARKLAEHEVVASEERFEQLARSTEVGFFLRTATQMLYMNDSLRTIFGVDHPGGAPSVADVLTFIHPDDQGLARETTAAADRGEATRADLRVVRPDGQTRWIRATNDPVRTSEGEPRVAGTITDITDRKATELAVVAAHRRAEEASAAKDEFLSRMSHELRTPLNAVLGFAQLLELDSAALSTTQNEGVGHIVRGGRHLLAMINDLLDITSIDANRLELTLEPVDLHDVVTDVVGLLQPLAAAGAVSVHLEPPGLPPGRWVRADQRRVRQVVINLLSNAIKYNRPGGRVDLVVLRTGHEVSLAVRDTGIGIPSEDLPLLFNPFERLGRQRTDIEGAGVGLALTLRLVSVMGGRLDVASVLDEGTTFTVTLPRASPAVAGAGDGTRDRWVPSEPLTTG